MIRDAGNQDVIVVGGGVIGLAVAWRARQRGMSVTLLEREAVGGGATRVAAGMLAPVAEVEFGGPGRRLLELGLRSGERWPAFAAELEAATERSVGLAATGTLMVARDDDEARELERQLAFRASLGLNARRMRPSESRELEPALAPTVRLALELPEDRAVDPRLVTSALRRACELAGVRVLEHVGPVALAVEGDSVRGVQLAAGERLLAQDVVVASGAWSAAVQGLPPGAGVPVRPVKGQTLRLRDPAGPGLLSRSVRFAEGYLVPRADGRYVLGGTVEERGFDDAPTAGGAYGLLRDAFELVPGVSELEIEELCVGLRPGTPDNLPFLGPGALRGLVWATGHYRNGILQAPLTAELVAELLGGGRPDEPLLDACAPERFGEGSAHLEPTAVGLP
jgi:glycine oxidase